MIPFNQSLLTLFSPLLVREYREQRVFRKHYIFMKSIYCFTVYLSSTAFFLVEYIVADGCYIKVQNSIILLFFLISIS